MVRTYRGFNHTLQKDMYGDVSDDEKQLTLGIKFDKDKLDYTLVPWESMEDVVKVLEHGAKKYARENWKLVSPERYKKAAARHMVAWLGGEDADPESGLPHTAHAICCMLFYQHLTKH